MTRKKVTKRKTKRKVAGRRPAKKPMPGWVFLLAGVLFGLAIAVYGYVNGWVPKVETPAITPQKEVTNKQPQVEDKSEELKLEKKKDYDFYTVLQDMEVVISDSDIKKPQPKDPINYMLQLGAFKNINDAEQLKAQVAFIGQVAHVQSIDIKDTRWHRVRIGPIDSGRQADVVKRNLEKNGFSVLIIKEK